MTATLIEHEYEPRGAQSALFYCKDAEVLLSGPAGTGKSRACLEKLHLYCLRYPGLKALIVRKVRDSLTNTALETWRSFVAREALLHGDMEWFGGSRDRSAQYTYTNGSMINVGGLDNDKAITKVMSSEYDLIYIQEATEITEDQWEKLTTRLRNGRAPIQQLLADCNPDTPTHWLKQRCDKGQTTMLNTQHEENPVLFYDNGVITDKGADYIAKLDALTGVNYQRLRRGLWVAASGIIYADWNPAIHIVPWFEPDKYWRHWWGVDFGWSVPFSWGNWVEDPDTGNLFLYQEIYRTNRLVADHAKVIKEVTRGQRRPDAIVCDSADPEGAATLEEAIGFSTRPAYKSVLEGIEAVQLRMRQRRLFIMQGAMVEPADQVLIDKRVPLHGAAEIPGYVWHERTTKAGLGVEKEGPVKEHDHFCDQMRYVVAHRDLVGAPSVRFVG